jgi:hypothetical protein
MWVAIDYRPKNWVAVLKSLGSTAVEGNVLKAHFKPSLKRSSKRKRDPNIDTFLDLGKEKTLLLKSSCSSRTNE